MAIMHQQAATRQAGTVPQILVVSVSPCLAVAVSLVRMARAGGTTQ